MPQTFTKTRPDAPEHFFAAEAAGLRWLAVPDGARIAGVRSVSRTSLTIDHVAPGSPTTEAAEEFGRRLAITHDAGASYFGVGPDGGPGAGWIGDAPLPLRTEPPARGAPGTPRTGCCSTPAAPTWPTRPSTG